MSEGARFLPVWRDGAAVSDAAWLRSGVASDEAALADFLSFGPPTGSPTGPPSEFPSGRPHVRAVMVSSLDGQSVGPEGSSRSISTPDDFWAFVTLRFLGDVILTGSATARAEQTRIPRGRPSLRAWRLAQGLSEVPVLAIPTLSGALPRTDLFSRAGACIVLTTPSRVEAVRARITAEHEVARGVTPWVVACGDDSARDESAERNPAAKAPGIAPSALIATLAAAVGNRIVCEGGPSLLGSLLAAGQVDDIAHSTTHVLAGGDITPFAELPLGVRTLTRRHLLLGPTADVGLYTVDG